MRTVNFDIQSGIINRVRVPLRHDDVGVLLLAAEVAGVGVRALSLHSAIQLAQVNQMFLAGVLP
ncbi:MAG: hypothetical protein ABSE79_07070 [Terriglobia bacterium]|jgi:hypothetical protein